VEASAAGARLALARGDERGGERRNETKKTKLSRHGALPHGSVSTFVLAWCDLAVV
jgi:hypothetical protein